MFISTSTAFVIAAAGQRGDRRSFIWFPAGWPFRQPFPVTKGAARTFVLRSKSSILSLWVPVPVPVVAR
eukprot:COSAG04_NODE_730_length_10737_cov_31.931002_11_plen_69_part_00